MKDKNDSMHSDALSRIGTGGFVPRTDSWLSNQHPSITKMNIARFKDVHGMKQEQSGDETTGDLIDDLVKNHGVKRVEVTHVRPKGAPSTLTTDSNQQPQSLCQRIFWCFRKRNNRVAPGPSPLSTPAKSGPRLT